jgi:glycosyltransferase involved in cell wall biosynthesis
MRHKTWNPSHIANASDGHDYYYGKGVPNIAQSVSLHTRTEAHERVRVVTIWAHYGPYHVARVDALEASGFDVIPYSYSKVVPTYEFFQESRPELRLINDSPTSNVNPVASGWRTLRQLWQDRPELILTCGYERPETLAALLYAYITRLTGNRTATVILMMDNQLSDRRRHKLVEAAKRLYLRLFDGFCVGGSTHVDYLVDLHVDLSKICFGYNCVDNSLIANIAARQRASGTTSGYSNYFLTLSRLVPKKNIPLIIDAYAAYRNLLPTDQVPWQLVVAGDGSARAHIEDRISHHNLGSSIHLIGRVDQFDEAVRYYAFCKAFVLASNRSEQWGLVVNEAMAAGVPVLVSRQCGCSGALVKPGVNGFVFDGNSVSELVDRLLWMHQNERRIDAMGQASLAIVAEYSPLNFAKNVAGYYWALRAPTNGSPSR